MIIEGGNDALRLDINVDRYGKPVKVGDPQHRNSLSMSHRIWFISYDSYDMTVKIPE